MQKIIPHLWFDYQAKEAIEHYTKLLPESNISNISVLENTPSGDVAVFDFTLGDLNFQAINGGPYFKFNEAISLFIAVDSKDTMDYLYRELSHEGEVLMPLKAYEFSPYYTWLSDKHGLNWQLMLNSEKRDLRTVRPCLMFGGSKCGLAESAMIFYSRLFTDGKIGDISYYAKGEASVPAAKVNYGELTIGGVDLLFMDHGYGGETEFNEAISLLVLCDDQQELDDYWEHLSHDPEAEQCGWLKDQFGVSWQIVPKQMIEMMKGSPEAIARVTSAFLSMKKFNIAQLEAAYNGEF